ncbi:MAG: FKBP-type peptidyl-prolyl cis-trans isomerase [Sphingobacteriales bacterium]|nr:FKBP-type peptidyl-prolyl cis-trans isomerase [Sphingobacteriales bacterium]
MKTIRLFGFFVLAAGFMTSCNKVTYRKTAGGMPYQLYKGNGSKKIFVGNILKCNLIYKIKDSVYFSSFGKLPVYMPVNQVAQPYDISEVLLKLKVGDSVIATQMMDTFIKRNPTGIPPEFKKGDRIVTTIKVLDVFTTDSAQTADEQKERKAFLGTEIAYLAKYLAEKNIRVEKTTSGAFVQVTNPGTGNQIDSGKYVSVNYTGTTLGGKKFDSNVDTAFHHVGPYPFTVSAGQMIKGFDEAVLFLKPGGSARVYIPSLLAYGANPDPQSGIKPFEHLVFDIQVVDVKDSAPVVKSPRNQPAEIKIDTTQQKK